MNKILPLSLLLLSFNSHADKLLLSPTVTGYHDHADSNRCKEFEKIEAVSSYIFDTETLRLKGLDSKTQSGASCYKIEAISFKGSVYRCDKEDGLTYNNTTLIIVGDTYTMTEFDVSYIWDGADSGVSYTQKGVVNKL